MFGGVSDRAKGRVTAANDVKKMTNMFNRTLGRNKGPVDMRQFVNWVAQATKLGKGIWNLQVIKDLKDGAGIDGMIEPSEVSQLMPDLVDQLHDYKAGGATTQGQAGPPPDVFPPEPEQSPAPVEQPAAPVEEPAVPEAPAPVEEPIEEPVAPEEVPAPIEEPAVPEAPAPVEQPVAPVEEPAVPEAPAPVEEPVAPVEEPVAPEEIPAPVEEPSAEVPMSRGKSSDKNNVVRRIRRNLNKGKPVSDADIKMMRDTGLNREYPVKFTDPKTGEKKTVTLHSLERRKTNRESVQHIRNTIGRSGFMGGNWGNF